MGKRIQGARKAYKSKSVEESKKYHTKTSIEKAAEKHTVESSIYLKDWIYGALDGIITTFAVVSGVTGASLGFIIILILGFANLAGDGISMAVGNYLGIKSEKDYYNTERRREEWEVENVPAGEIEEIREIYKKKGFEGKPLEDVVKTITSNKKVWVNEMMIHELGLMDDEKSPAKAGLATFAAFVLAGLVPLLSYLFALSFPAIGPYSFIVAVILTAITLFGVGSARALVIDKKWYIAGLEMLVVGGIAAIAAFYIGYAASLFIGA
ncbi:MAG: VIT1/CCC1 transporter family protein [Candidatus Aenigmatarchaeota archaeon]